MPPQRTIVTLAWALAQLALAAAALTIAIDWRSPLFSAWRSPALALLIGIPVVLIAFELRAQRRPNSRLRRTLGLGILLLAASALVVVLVLEGRFHRIRSAVLQAEPDRLAKLGRHIIIGYHDPAEIDELLARRAIAGVFITARNVEGLSADAVARQVAAWQQIRRDQGLPALFIATDQEGGAVSRLSPPLPRQPPLATLVDGKAGSDAATVYGRTQGRALAAVGVNLNFAPVVDLNFNRVDPADQYTRVYARAISGDPTVVANVAGRYCRGLAEFAVRCTLKHFPGLGRVVGDTHLQSADLLAPLSELERSDWIPFRAVMNEAGMIMLGHARLAAIDPLRPASFSHPVVTGLLRTGWGYDGVLVTDDFSMRAVYASADGLAEASVRALNVGVDLILVSYDAPQYFTVMDALLRADRAGRLSHKGLAASKRRLDRVAPAVSAAGAGFDGR